MIRLVCRSTPLPTKHIAEEMREDECWRQIIVEAERLGVHPAAIARSFPCWAKVKRRTLARPADTDVGQCWSEEIFSLLNAS